MTGEPNMDVRLSPRSRQVLTAIIEAYIESGEPVASQAVAQRQGQRDGLSAASVRNTMAELAEAGLLDQPHTSAGRVPTAKAFRFYTQQVMNHTRVLGDENRARIEDELAGIQSPQEFLEKTSHVLAALSSGVGVAMRGPGEDAALEHVHFQRLAAKRVLAVVVMRSGEVRDRVLVLEGDLGTPELEASARYLVENFRGQTLERVRQDLAWRLEAERGEYDRLRQSLEQIALAGAFAPAAMNSADIFVDGVANLVVGESDRERLREMLSALQEKQRVVALLNAYVDASAETVRVIVGLEDAAPEMRNLVLVAAPARLAGESVGTLAVIGSTRMQYEQTIGTVQYVAQLFERLLERAKDDEPKVM
jgi:heat-inducible transcriptional repressor